MSRLFHITSKPTLGPLALSEYLIVILIFKIFVCLFVFAAKWKEIQFIHLMNIYLLGSLSSSIRIQASNRDQ